MDPWFHIPGQPWYTEFEGEHLLSGGTAGVPDRGEHPTEPERHAPLVLLHLTDCGDDEQEGERHEDGQNDPPGEHDSPDS